MIAPTVNIVMTSRPEVMMAFQEAESFTAFSEERKAQDELDKQAGIPQHTYIFNNSPNSTFLELKHSYAPKDGMTLEVEIIDPQGTFEEAMLDNTFQSMLPIEDDPLAAKLQRDIDEINYTSTQALKLKMDIFRKELTGIPPSEKERASSAALNDQRLAQLDDGDKTWSADQGVGGEKAFLKLRQLEAALDAAKPQLQRPMYISYGMGNNLADWSPPQCYGNVYRVEYQFKGRGARTLKLIFAGASANPNLISNLGVSPFGKAFSQGLLTQGRSNSLFNAESALAQAQEFKDYVFARDPQADPDEVIDKYIGDSKRPSFHVAVTTAIREFIKAGSTEENVYVLLPNLDYYLEPYLQSHIDAAEARVGEPSSNLNNANSASIPHLTKKDLAYFEGFKTAIEGIGLTLSECDRFTQPGRPISKSQPIGENVYANLENQSRADQEVDKWFQTRDFRAVVQCDYERGTSFIDKLSQIATSLRNKFDEWVREDTGGLQVMLTGQPKTETDVSMLKLMQDATLIPTAAKPAIYWGDERLINSYLYAWALEQSAKGAEKDNWSTEEKQNFISDNLEEVIHPIDILNGLDYNYLQSVVDYVMPIAWLGPFGPNNSGDVDALPDDTNSQEGAFAALKANQPLKASRMPVFTFGSKNPNIINFDLDINNIYFHALAMATPRPKPSQSIVTGIIAPGQERGVAQMFADLERIAEKAVQDDPSLNRPPEEFKTLVAPWFDRTTDPDGDGRIVADWEYRDLFGDLGEALEVSIYENSMNDSMSEDLFTAFMWKAWVTLYNKSNIVPLSEKHISNNSYAANIVTSTSMKDKVLNSAIRGSITTVPLFHLSTARRVITRPCQVICVEPKFHGAGDDSEVNAQRTWFSGRYELIGFVHTITGSRASSKFQVMKSPSKGSELQEETDEDAITPQPLKSWQEQQASDLTAADGNN